MNRSDDAIDPKVGGKVFDRLALVVFVLLIVLRIAYAAQAWERSPVLQQPLADSIVYVEEARRIATGASSDGQPFYRAPLYPYVLAPLFALSDDPAPMILLLQVGLGIGTLALCWSITRRLFGPAAALASLILLGLFGPLAGFETKILGTTLGIFLGMVGLRLLAGARRDRRVFFGGLFVGIASLARPGLLLFGAVAVLLFWSRSSRGGGGRLRQAALIAAGLLAGIAPATIHNLRAGDLVLISSNGGLTFYDGNHRDNETGLYEPAPLTGRRGNAVDQAREDRARASELAGCDLTFSESSRFWMNKGLEELLSDPVHAVRLGSRKLIRFFGIPEIADNYSHLVEVTQVPRLRLFPVPFPLIVILAVLAMVVRGFRRRDELLVLAYAGVAFLTCLVFFVNSRYRCEAVPALAILAGALIAELPRSSFRRRLVGLGVAIPLTGMALVPGGSAIQRRESVAAAQWAGSLERENRLAEALSLYRAAVGLDPLNAPAWGKWSRLAREIEGLDAGIEVLDSAIAAGADGPLIRLERGTALIALGRLAEAEADLRIAHGADRSDPSIALNLAACLVHRGADLEAEALLANPGLRHEPIALYYRGLIALRNGKPSEAIERLDQAVADGAKDPRPLFLRAIAWLRTGKQDLAADWLSGWAESSGIDLADSQIDQVLDILSSDPASDWPAGPAPADPVAAETIGGILEKVREALGQTGSP